MKSYEPVLGVMRLDRTPLITHDDRLLLRAQKSELGLWLNWRDGTRVARRDGAPVVVRWHHVDDVAKTASEPPVGDEENWRPQYERVVPLDGVRVSLKFNQVDVELLDLQNDLRSRYRKALEVLADMVRVGVVRYEPRVPEPTERNVLEALRHRMRRYAKVTEYEHNLMFRGELGARMFEALRSHDRAPKSYENTVYLRGFNRYVGLQVSQKFYNVSRKENRDDAPGEELWKLETLFRKGYFKAHNLRDVAEFIEQPDIQEQVLFENLTRHLAYVLRLCREGGVKLEQFELGLGALSVSPREQARSILRRELTLTERVETLERKVKQHDATLEKHAEQLERIESNLRNR